MTNVFILSKIILVGSSFLFGCFLCKFIIIKQNSVSVFYKLLFKIYSFNFIELFVLFTTFYLLVRIVFNIIMIYILNNYNMVFELYQIIELLNYIGISTVDIGIIDIPESSTINISESSTGDNNSNTTNNSSNSTNNSSNNSSNTSTNNTTNTSKASTKTPNAPYNNAVDAMLMGAANAAGVKLMQYTPSLAGKAAIGVGSIVAGSAAIVAKNVSGNLSKDIGNNFIDPSIFNEMFGLTGDSVRDLLQMLLVFQYLQLFFIYLICYNYLISNLEIVKIEVFLNYYLSKNIVIYIIKLFTISKKLSKILMISSFLLLIFSNFNSYYYLNFFIDNFDNIIEYMSKK